MHMLDLIGIIWVNSPHNVTRNGSCNYILKNKMLRSGRRKGIPCLQYPIICLKVTQKYEVQGICAIIAKRS